MLEIFMKWLSSYSCSSVLIVHKQNNPNSKEGKQWWTDCIYTNSMNNKISAHN